MVSENDLVKFKNVIQASFASGLQKAMKVLREGDSTTGFFNMKKLDNSKTQARFLVDFMNGFDAFEEKLSPRFVAAFKKISKKVKQELTALLNSKEGETTTSSINNILVRALALADVELK
ncbi:MAG: hypothetical protein KAT77_03790 [Nanoarchaeota archaeon]|nr:hypothetical protein [Nanoarchaeota archaeon]